MKRIKVEAKKLNKNAIVPKYAHEYGDSGMDTFANNIKISGRVIDLYEEKYSIPPKSTVLIGTGMAYKVPLGYELQVRPTSGNSLKTPLRIANSPATIDSNYRGEVGIIASNISEKPLEIKAGAKIAQLVLSEVPIANVTVVKEFSEDVYDNSRGEDGYGSTGTL